MSKADAGPDLPKNLSILTPGFNFGTGTEGNRLTGSVERKNTQGLAAINARFPRILSDFDRLRGEVEPGFGALTRAGTTAIGDARTKAIGDLRENLNRRRILGSSFANDALIRAESQFGRDDAQFRAQAKLQELDTFSKLLSQEQGAINSELARDLAESQFTAQVSSNMINTLNANLGFLKSQAAEDAAGLGSLIGTVGGGIAGSVFGPVGTAAGAALGSRASNLFSPTTPPGGGIGGGLGVTNPTNASLSLP